MLDKEYYFSGQVKDEKIISFYHRHWISFLWPAGLIGAVCFLLPTIIYLSSPVAIGDFLFRAISETFYYILVVVIGVLEMIILAILFRAWIDYYFDVTIITTDHLIDIKQIGLFNRKISEQSLLRVQDVSSKRKGLLQTYFGYGDVVVETAGDTPNFEMQNMPYPDGIASEIMNLHAELVEHGAHRIAAAVAEGEIKPTNKRRLPTDDSAAKEKNLEVGENNYSDQKEDLEEGKIIQL